ncbi:hypothetical protein CPB84DRAFT_1635800, partial [Gymnopilus junonius]
GAFHDSGERFDPPRCHPNTRTAVIQRIMDWVHCDDLATQQVFILWLHGAAGAGKSAIAQTIAELCYAQGILLSSFFFSREDLKRNHPRALFPTISYQMALEIPQLRERLACILERDPLLLTRSLSAQFFSLVVQPIKDLYASG